ncbi:odorant receptor 131-2-like [Parambassis ranga]|uniref:Odorant receptor 131-2-like n=1 Tax=Parambassis ranga TaxID=210632 RepID=A0A6P7JQX8_9TELE|nr:odorant receptor 131-2-like [Parambassis ranga]
MSSQAWTNTTDDSMGLVEKMLLVTLTTISCCIFLIINVIMLFTLRSRPVFRETCRYILLYNLLFADTVQIAVSQLLYILSVCRIMLTYPVCGVFIMFANLTSEISPLTLVVMSLERYVAVCYPLRHTTIITIRNTGAAIAAVWAFCSLNTGVRVLLLLQFPFEQLQSLQMKQFCSTFLMFLTPVTVDYDKAYTCFLFVSAGLSVISSYIGVIIAARSASTDKASARRARNTLLLHLVQLCLILSSTIHNPLLIAASNVVTRTMLIRIQNILYVFIIVLPRCLSALIYGIRDKTIRPVLLYYLCCRLKLSER